MSDRIQIKVRMKGNDADWEDIAALPFTVPQKKLMDAIMFLSSLEGEHHKIVEIRWNYVGSLQGNYISFD